MLIAAAACSADRAESRTDNGAAATFRVWLADLEEGLELHYTFQDHSGSTITDMSGNGRHGTLQGGSIVSSPWGEAVSFDGVDDYISLVGPRDPALYGGVNGEMTVHARVRVADAEHYNTLCFGCGPWSGTAIGTSEFGPRVQSAVYNQDTGGKLFPQSTQSLQDNTWVDVTMVIEGGVGTRYYLDCELDATFTNEDVGLHNYNYSSIGQAPTGTNHWFDGEIDDLRIWNRALSDNELLLACAEPEDELCGGAPEGASLVDPPNPPTSYTLPSEELETVTAVEDAEELEDAVNAGTYEDIILESGTYDHVDLTGDWLQIRGHRLWARTVGGAVLNFGISGGGNNGFYDYSGSEIHGLAFDIDDVSHAPDANNSAEVLATAFLIWGDASDTVVEDSTFDGNSVMDAAVFAGGQLDGLEITRVVIDDFDRYGIVAGDADSTTLTNPMLMQDVVISRVGDPDCWGVEELECGYYPGTQETGIHLGDLAVIDRVRIRDVRAAGIATGSEVDGAVLTNLDIDRIGVGHSIMGGGVGFEQTTRNTLVDSFCVGPFTRIGVNSEWDHNVAPRGISNEVSNGLVQAHFIGAGGDQGTVDFEVHDITFRNYSRAGVLMFNNLDAEENWPDYAQNVGGVQYDNVFEETEVEGVICDFTRNHFSDATPDCE